MKQRDQRKFVRLNFLVDVIYHKRQLTQKHKLTLSKNIGVGGICLIVYEKLIKGQLLELDIYLPKTNVPVKAIGRVSWVNEFIIGDPIKGKRYDVGIQFVEIKKNNLSKVNKYVFSHKTPKN